MKKLCIKVTYHTMRTMSVMVFRLAEILHNISGSMELISDDYYWKFNDSPISNFSKEKFNG